MEEVVYEVNAEQTSAVRVKDGAVLEFVPKKKPTCDDCVIRTQAFPEGLPCSPGTRKDNKQGIWRIK